MSRRMHALMLALLLAVVAGGAWLRLAGLDRAPLRDDELNHFYVATALERGDHPMLPSGEWYLRGMAFTRAVQLSLRHVEPAELAVRLPSALFGSLALALFAAIAWSVAGPFAALLATLLMALFPELVGQSRSGRFYSLQLVYGLVAFWAGWRALSAAMGEAHGRAQLLRVWGWCALAGGALVLAMQLQVTTASSGLALGLVLAAVAARDSRRWRFAALRRSAPLQLVALAGLAGVTLLILRPDTLPQTVVRAVSVPHWAELQATDPFFYVDAIALSLPVLALAGPFAFWHLARTRPALGGYLAVWFLVPLVVHTLLPWRSTRFIVLALPALVLATGIALAHVLALLHARLRTGAAWRRPAATFAVALLALLAAVPPVQPGRAFAGLERAPVDAWSAALRVADEVRVHEALPLAHTRSLPAYHYWTTLDFTVNEGLREQWRTRERKLDEFGVDEEGGYVWLPMGTADLYTGVPVLSTPDAIRDRFGEAGGVLIGLDSPSMLRNGVRPELAAVLEQEATELCRGQCGPMLLYLWRFGAD